MQRDPVYVWGDEFKIEEVVTNYVSNALNHVDYDKKIEVKILQKRDLVRVSVFNTGDPIPQEDLDKIWIKFYKVDKARTREYGGSGIGLSIVKAIMDSMNQKCGVTNYDNGVEFWFELQSAAAGGDFYLSKLKSRKGGGISAGTVRNNRAWNLHTKICRKICIFGSILLN